MISQEKTKQQNPHLPQIPDNSYRILIVGGSGLGKTNALLNLINYQPYIDKIYLYTKDLYKSKYQYIINTCEAIGLKHFQDPKVFSRYSSDMQDVYDSTGEYHAEKKPSPSSH